MLQQTTLNRSGWLKDFAFNRPVIFSILAFLAAILLTEIPLQGAFLSWAGIPAAKFIEGILEQVIGGLLFVALIVRLGLWRQARFNPPGQWKALWLVWPLVLFALLNSSEILDGSHAIDFSRTGLIVLYGLYLLAIGFFEESVGRGLILPVMLQKWGSTRRGIYLAVIASSLLFGSAHIIQLIDGSKPLLPNLTQIAYAFFFGVAFSACFLRNNSIWPVMILHGLIDFSGRDVNYLLVGGGEQIPMANTTLAGSLTTLLILLPLLLYGLFILRKVEPEKG